MRKSPAVPSCLLTAKTRERIMNMHNYLLGASHHSFNDLQMANRLPEREGAQLRLPGPEPVAAILGQQGSILKRLETIFRQD
jgi:hypothetical protein